jgi:insertion element IS1 protein InsB
MNCRYCNGACIKKGKQSGCQKLYCKNCGKYQQETYVRRIFDATKQSVLEFMNGEGNSISTISRFLKFSRATISRWIEKLGSNHQQEIELQQGDEYQVDELRTYVGSKRNESWIMYAINKATGKIVSWCVGRRTKENLNKVTSELLSKNPKLIYTDGLPMYSTVIPSSLHEVRKTKTNKIERRNLQLRMQLKRLSRKTICFSRSENMLRSSFMLYLKYVMSENKCDYVL